MLEDRETKGWTLPLTGAYDAGDVRASSRDVHARHGPPVSNWSRLFCRLGVDLDVDLGAFFVDLEGENHPNMLDSCRLGCRLRSFASSSLKLVTGVQSAISGVHSFIRSFSREDLV